MSVLQTNVSYEVGRGARVDVVTPVDSRPNLAGGRELEEAEVWCGWCIDALTEVPWRLVGSQPPSVTLPGSSSLTVDLERLLLHTAPYQRYFEVLYPKPTSARR